VISVKVLYCLVCDDVRHEVNAKEIVIGVYTGGIKVPAVPFTANVCLWFAVAWAGEGATTVWARILGPRGNQLWTNAGTARAISPGLETSYTFRNALIAVEEQGFYEIQWRMAEEEWVSVRKFAIFTSAEAAVAR
jgi:hypothetical protein